MRERYSPSPFFSHGVFFAVLLTIIVSIILKMNHILNIMLSYGLIHKSQVVFSLLKERKLFIFNITQTIMVRKRASEQKGDKT